MNMKSMLVAAIGLTGLTLSSCVEEGPYRTSGYSPGYYNGGAIFIGGGDRYRYRYDRNRYYRHRYHGHHEYHRSGRPEYRSHRQEDRGHSGGHHRIIFDKNLSR